MQHCTQHMATHILYIIQRCVQLLSTLLSSICYMSVCVRRCRTDQSSRPMAHHRSLHATIHIYVFEFAGVHTHSSVHTAHCDAPLRDLLHVPACMCVCVCVDMEEGGGSSASVGPRTASESEAAEGAVPRGLFVSMPWLHLISFLSLLTAVHMHTTIPFQGCASNIITRCFTTQNMIRWMTGGGRWRGIG